MNANDLVEYWLPRKFSVDMAEETVDVIRDLQGRILELELDVQFYMASSFECNGFCGEYECKDHQDVCKRIIK